MAITEPSGMDNPVQPDTQGLGAIQGNDLLPQDPQAERKGSFLKFWDKGRKDEVPDPNQLVTPPTRPEASFAFATRLGIDGTPIIDSANVPAPATGKPTVSARPNLAAAPESLTAPTETPVADTLLEEVPATVTSPGISINGISPTTLTAEAASQPVSPGITPDMGGVLGEPQVPAESPAAVGGDIAYEDLRMELLEELRESLEAADEAIKRAKEATDKLGVNPTDASKDLTVSTNEPVGTTS